MAKRASPVFPVPHSRTPAPCGPPFGRPRHAPIPVRRRLRAKGIAAALVEVPRAVATGKADPGAQVPIALVQRDDTARIDDLLAQNAQDTP